MEGRVRASSEPGVFAGKDGGVRHPHDSGSIGPGRWADMNIEGPYLGQLDASFSARRHHLGATPEESATRCSTGRAQAARFCRKWLVGDRRRFGGLLRAIPRSGMGTLLAVQGGRYLDVCALGARRAHGAMADGCHGRGVWPVCVSSVAPALGA